MKTGQIQDFIIGCTVHGELESGAVWNGGSESYYAHMRRVDMTATFDPTMRFKRSNSKIFMVFLELLLFLCCWHPGETLARSLTALLHR